MTAAPGKRGGPREAGTLKAMVLAAGAGTRLRPLTYATPKPMVPVVNRPVLHHVLDNLARHGIRDAVLNLWAYPGQVRDYCGDGSRWGLRLRYSRERTLLGTAGAVKKMERFFRDGPLLIMSGDGLSDVDITALYAFHRERRSLATMVTKGIDARFAYGVTLAGKTGRIRGFLEKPSWGQVFSNQVNTGIYLFEPGVLRHIPKGFYDFGHELWPKLLRLKKPIYAWEWKGYWCDVGNLAEYRNGQRAALKGEVAVEVPGRRLRRGVWVEEGARIHPRARLVAPCAVGARARVERGAVVGPCTTVGAGAKIGRNAIVKNCILFDKTAVGAGAYLDNCILGAGGAVRSGAIAYDAAVMDVRH
ncbi:MAG: NDP-sugar synthase [Elusimicrobiota bacterium]